jgi:hypothetical protein
MDKKRFTAHNTLFRMFYATLEVSRRNISAAHNSATLWRSYSIANEPAWAASNG